MNKSIWNKVKQIKRDFDAKFNLDDNAFTFECPLIIEGISADPATSRLKRKISSQALPDFLLAEMGITKENIFVVELTSDLFLPMFKKTTVWVVEKFSEKFISGKHYLFNINNKLVIYKVDQSLTSTTLLDCNNQIMFRINNDEENSVLKCVIGRFRYFLACGESAYNG